MNYSESLMELIRTTVGVDPLTHSPDYIRQKLENLNDEIQDMVFGHIGVKNVKDDVVITAAENNSLYRVRNVYNEFMDAYEKFLIEQ